WDGQRGRSPWADRAVGEARRCSRFPGRRLDHTMGRWHGIGTERTGPDAMNALVDHPLPKVRGTYAENAPLKDLVWFRAGGAADILYRPADVEDVTDFMAHKPAGLSITVLGAGSNLLIRDGGIP